MTPEHQVIGALVTAIVFMFGVLLKKNAAQDKALADCNTDRERLNGEVLKQKDQIIDIWKSLAKAGIKPIAKGETPNV